MIALTFVTLARAEARRAPRTVYLGSFAKAVIQDGILYVNDAAVAAMAFAQDSARKEKIWEVYTDGPSTEDHPELEEFRTIAGQVFDRIEMTS
jgi:hypothetical protein